MTDLREAIRALLLPMDTALEGAALVSAAEALSDAGVAEEDHAEFVRVASQAWADGEECPEALSEVIAAALEAGDPEIGEVLADSYLDLHDSLQEKHHLSFWQASAFLSHARLAAHLAAAEKLSAAQIARVLSARDERADFHWRAVETLLQGLQLAPKLSEDEVKALIAADKDLEERLFADAGVEEAAALVGGAADRLGFPGDLSELLLRLVDPDLTMHGPYLKMLFYQCVIAEFYDHALTWIYEFSPRGVIARHVANDVLGELEGGSTPFLDNAKSVDRLDIGWARSKKPGELDRATALAEAVEGLEEMGFAARQELAAWLRRWVLRITRLTRPLQRAVPTSPSASEVRSVLAALEGSETRTTGIIEQRVVDAVAASRWLVSDGWRANGLGDSVNASNVSRRKVGDCEFQNSQGRRVVAYEAHAGRLSDVYVDGHVQSLGKVIPLRADEWERIADLAEWEVEIVFVAHEPLADDRAIEIEGVRVVIRSVSFADFFGGAPPAAGLRAPFATHVNAHLNETRTPQAVREAYLKLIGG